MAKKIAKKKLVRVAYIICNRGVDGLVKPPLYHCEVCGGCLNKIIKNNLKEFISKALDNKLNLLKIYCPQCESRLNFSGLQVRLKIEDRPNKVHPIVQLDI